MLAALLQDQGCFEFCPKRPDIEMPMRSPEQAHLIGSSHPMLAQCLRVTVGTPDENARFLGALKESLVAC